MMKRLVALLALVILPTSLQARADENDVHYELVLEIDGEEVSRDEFYGRKPPDEAFPPAARISFRTDEVSLILKFRVSVEGDVAPSGYHCDFNVQTRSGFVLFEFSQYAKRSEKATLLEDGTLQCHFRDLSDVLARPEHRIGAEDVYLFELWVIEFGQNWTYLPIHVVDELEPSKETNPVDR